MTAMDAVGWALAVLIGAFALIAVLFAVAFLHDVVVALLPRRERK